MKIWLVSNILGNLKYQESFNRKIYFIIKAFQWRKRWSVHREMACWGGVKSTKYKYSREFHVISTSTHFEPIFMAIKSNFMMRRHDWNTKPLQRQRTIHWTGHFNISQYFQLDSCHLFSIGGGVVWWTLWYPASSPSYLTLLAGAHFTILNWKFLPSFCSDSWKLASISVIIRKKN